MREILLIPAGIFLILVFIYALYINGVGTAGSKRAVKYIGSRNGAQFTLCSGTLRRVIRFSESRTYQFELDCFLSHGTMSVEILDSQKNPLLILSEKNKSGSVQLTKKTRYYLATRFQKATGEYTLHCR